MTTTTAPEPLFSLNARLESLAGSTVSLRLHCSEASCTHQFRGSEQENVQMALQVGQPAAIDSGWSIRTDNAYCPDHTAELARRDLIHGSARRPAGNWPPAGELTAAERATVVRFGTHEEDIQNLAALAVGYFPEQRMTMSLYGVYQED